MRSRERDFFNKMIFITHLTLLFRFGSDALRREFLASAISGDMVSSIAVSESTGGSDVASRSKEFIHLSQTTSFPTPSYSFDRFH